MKHALIAFGGSLIFALIAYLGMAFIRLDPDLSRWAANDRGALVSVFFLAFVPCFAVSVLREGR